MGQNKHHYLLLLYIFDDMKQLQFADWNIQPLQHRLQIQIFLSACTTSFLKRTLCRALLDFAAVWRIKKMMLFKRKCLKKASSSKCVFFIVFIWCAALPALLFMALKQQWLPNVTCKTLLRNWVKQKRHDRRHKIIVVNYLRWHAKLPCTEQGASLWEKEIHK